MPAQQSTTQAIYSRKRVALEAQEQVKAEQENS